MAVWGGFLHVTFKLDFPAGPGRRTRRPSQPSHATFFKATGSLGSFVLFFLGEREFKPSATISWPITGKKRDSVRTRRIDEAVQHFFSFGQKNDRNAENKVELGTKKKKVSLWTYTKAVYMYKEHGTLIPTNQMKNASTWCLDYMQSNCNKD